MDKTGLAQAIDALSELVEDSTVPKNIKAKLECMISLLNGNAECSIKVSRVLHEIEEIDSDSNMQPYTRMQIFSVVSMLEKI